MGWRGPSPPRRGLSPPRRAGDGVWAPLVGFNPFPWCPWLCPQPCCPLCPCVPRFPRQDQLLSPTSFVPVLSPACTGARDEPSRPHHCQMGAASPRDVTAGRMPTPVPIVPWVQHHSPARARAIAPWSPAATSGRGRVGWWGLRDGQWLAAKPPSSRMGSGRGSGPSSRGSTRDRGRAGAALFRGCQQFWGAVSRKRPAGKRSSGWEMGAAGGDEVGYGHPQSRTRCSVGVPNAQTPGGWRGWRVARGKAGGIHRAPRARAWGAVGAQSPAPRSGPGLLRALPSPSFPKKPLQAPGSIPAGSTAAGGSCRRHRARPIS